MKTENKIFWLIGCFLAGFGASWINIGLGIMVGGFLLMICSFVDDKYGNKNTKEGNSESNNR